MNGRPVDPARGDGADAVRLEKQGPGTYALSGPLTFESVADAWSRTQTLLDAEPTMEIDLAGVSRTDSAGLALIIEYLRAAERRNAHIRFRNIPSQMFAIAKASRLDRLLLIAQGAGPQ